MIRKKTINHRKSFDLKFIFFLQIGQFEISSLNPQLSHIDTCPQSIAIDASLSMHMQHLAILLSKNISSSLSGSSFLILKRKFY